MCAINVEDEVSKPGATRIKLLEEVNLPKKQKDTTNVFYFKIQRTNFE